MSFSSFDARGILLENLYLVVALWKSRDRYFRGSILCRSLTRGSRLSHGDENLLVELCINQTGFRGCDSSFMLGKA